MLPPAAKQKLIDLLGPGGYLDRPEDLALYEYDGSVEKGRPELVVFPRTTEDVVAIVRITGEFGVPIVGRGAGTGLSGGAIPRDGGVVVGFARMNRILEIDLENERAAGASPAWSTWISRWRSNRKATSTRPIPPASAPAPWAATWRRTPAARTRWPTASPPTTCWAWNWCCRTAPWSTRGGKETDLPGYDLTGLLTGSEGTMALVTKIMVRLMRKPEMVKTILAIYDDALTSTIWPCHGGSRIAGPRWPRSPRAPSLRSPSRCWMA